MDRFTRILFVINGPDTDSGALTQALSLALHNQGELSVLLVHPALPEGMEPWRQSFTDFLTERFDDCLEKAKSELGVAQLPDSLNFRLHTHDGHAPQVHVIRRVLLEGHNLVFKAADPADRQEGFTALDMGLLRTCPVPVWLWRPSASRRTGDVAVAVDPADNSSPARALSLRLLEAASHLATLLEKKLEVISCWEFPMESYLRNRAFGGTPQGRLEEIAADDRRRHRAALDTLVDEAGLDKPPRIHHYRGLPQERIPEFTRENHTHTLVMGTLARTGIPGFVIGNTAEDVVRRLPCSLLAMKPPGFESPVKPEG